MNRAELKGRLARVAAKVAQKFRKGNHENGLIGVLGGGALVGVGWAGWLGYPVSNLINTLSYNSSLANQYGSFANEVGVLLGAVGIVLGLNEYRKWRLRKQILNE
jgi:hypothetical protein